MIHPTSHCSLTPARVRMATPPVVVRSTPYPSMITDTTLTNLANGLGVTAMLLVVAYHFIAVNADRALD